MNWITLRKPLIMGLLMVGAAVLSIAATPRHFVADTRPKISLETMIPEAFGTWSVDKSVAPLVADPAATAVLNRIYNQTLARTYIDDRGTRVMLSIAYGGDQSDAMQVHKPEVCYPAQGFQVMKQMFDVLASPFGDIPVKRLVAAQGRRVEPITYWITIGDSVASSSVSWKLQQLRYGLTGKVPDGLLFRVSMISASDAEAFKVHDEFVRLLLSSLPEGNRVRLIGSPTS